MIESGILCKSLLSLKRERLPFLKTETSESRFTAIYKHYILIFDPQGDEEEKDCVVFNTQNGTTTHLKTGIDLDKRSRYSFCHWKNNIFVSCGGYYRLGPRTSQSFAASEKVYLLYFIEKNGNLSLSDPQKIFLGQVSFESCKLPIYGGWAECHSAQVYQDNMYIFEQELGTLKKFDLSKELC